MRNLSASALTSWVVSLVCGEFPDSGNTTVIAKVGSQLVLIFLEIPKSKKFKIKPVRIDKAITP